MKNILRVFFFQFWGIAILNRINFIDSKHGIPINIVFGDENFDFSFRKVFPKVKEQCINQPSMLIHWYFIPIFLQIQWIKKWNILSKALSDFFIGDHSIVSSKFYYFLNVNHLISFWYSFQNIIVSSRQKVHHLIVNKWAWIIRHIDFGEIWKMTIKIL